MERSVMGVCARLAACGSIGCAAVVLGGVDLGGGAAGFGMNSCPNQTWTYDTGASITPLNRACATQLGLFADADGDGMPDAATDMINANAGSVQLWCFPNVLVVSKDSDGQVCADVTTVYVSKNNDFWGGQNLLGNAIRKRFKGQWDDETEKVKWREQFPFIREILDAIEKAINGLPKIRSVIPDIGVPDGTGIKRLDMAFFSGSEHSFVPASFVAQLVPPPPIVGEIDLAGDPFLELMGLEEFNPDGQTVFPVVELPAVDLGFSFGPVPGPFQALVVQGPGLDTGILGRSWLVSPPGVPRPRYFEGEDGEFLFIPCEADINDDGLVNFADVAAFVNAFNATDPLADLNGDGLVNLADVQVFVNAFTQCSALAG